MAKTVLGLDLGPNSIGWALVRDSESEQGEIIDLGVRVFPEGVDAFDTSKEKSRNEQRRIARGMRRQTRRRVARRRKLVAALIEASLWPPGSASQEALYALDPYDLRQRATKEKLELHEFGRVLIHLNQRRGFLSNRKKDRGDKEAQGMLAEINDNEAKRNESGLPSIGAWLASKMHELDHTSRKEDDHVRSRHLARIQYYAEFELIWQKQAEYHPEVLTEELRWGKMGSFDSHEDAIKPRKPISRYDSRRKGLTDLQAFGLHGIIFFQRPMYWPKSVVGLCELEPKQKRCPKADRHAEKFRLYQEINNLRYADPDTHVEKPLDEGQRSIVYRYLSTREKATFDQIRKQLTFLDTVKFNLERGKRTSMKGMTLDHMLAKQSGLKKSWYEIAEEDRNKIVEALRDNERDDDLVVRKLLSEFGLTAEQADDLLDADLPIGYVSLSRVAIDKLLPHLAKGLIYQSESDPEKSALHAAGYLRADELQKRLFDFLPDLRRVNPRDCKLGDLPNPVVKRALTELRKVVNAIIREYGKPDAIHVEMARSLRMGPDARSEYNSKMKLREKAREDAANAIRELGIKVRREGIIRYLLWQEQSHECIYSGKPISLQQLFGGGVDIDHILPYSRCLDDSQANKVVCHREFNQGKGQQTPHEWLAESDSETYRTICLRAGTLMRKGLMPYNKYRRFLQKELDLNNFIARQLTDTAYITKAAVEYLKLLFGVKDSHKVLGLKGQQTAELRWQWGLDTILSELPDSPAWQEDNDLHGGAKNRADHRHHTIDAVVVAMTNRKRLQALSKLVKKGGAKKHGEMLFDPWGTFREDVAKRIASVNVSHRVERKVRGALHEETLYGPTENPDEWVVRKSVDSLSAAEIDRIRDSGIKSIITDALRDAGLEYGRGKKPNAKKMKEVLSSGLSMPSGVPIKKVRLIKPEKTIAPLREEGSQSQAYVKPGSTHHLCVFEYEEKGKTKRDAVFVTMLEATQRIKRGEPIISRIHPERPDAKFVMSLSSRELVLVENDGKSLLLQFKTAASTQGQIYFSSSTDARKSSDQEKLVFSANTLRGKKITICPLGRIRWAND